jgi:hypothetical protein
MRRKTDLAIEKISKRKKSWVEEEDNAWEPKLRDYSSSDESSEAEAQKLEIAILNT